MNRHLPPVRTSMRASNDRWLFGYADVVTLLFACFASLYAARVVPAEAAVSADQSAPASSSSPASVAAPSTADSTATATAAESPETAPAASPSSSASDPSAPTSSDAEVGERALEKELAAVVGREGTLPGVELSASVRGIVISLPEAGSFPPGRAELSESARQVMRELADRLRAMPNPIRVEGHTDNTPIHTPLFASNWELSTARATRVIQFLIEACEIDPTRLSAAGYGEQRPRVSNTSTELRARNRRVDIVVLDEAAASLEAPMKADR